MLAREIRSAPSLRCRNPHLGRDGVQLAAVRWLSKATPAKTILRISRDDMKVHVRYFLAGAFSVGQ